MVKDKNSKTIEPHPADNIQNKQHVCITSGIQTTALTRLKLYDLLEKLGPRIYYCDTASILYLQRHDNEYCPDLSPEVGGLNDELESFRIRDDYRPWIKSFVCVAPKTYAYCVINNDQPNAQPIYIVKCKGIHINSEN